MRRSRKIRQNIILLLVATLAMLLLLEGLLRTVDPLGIDALTTTLWRISDQMDTDDPRGFGLPPGRYKMPGWTLNINEDRNRVTPNAVDTDCEILFVGDSVTIGQGVQDEEVWVNLLAADAPVTFKNAGFSGYNIYHVANTIETRNANGYIYLLIGNDASTQVPFERAQTAGALQTFIQRRLLRGVYSYVALLRSGILERESPPTDPNVPLDEIESPEQYTNFLETFETLVTRDDVLVMGLSSEELVQAAAQEFPQIVMVERYTSYVSWIDTHADAAGNRQLAETVREPVMAFTERICGT